MVLRICVDLSQVYARLDCFGEVLNPRRIRSSCGKVHPSPSPLLPLPVKKQTKKNRKEKKKQKKGGKKKEERWASNTSGGGASEGGVPSALVLRLQEREKKRWWGGSREREVGSNTKGR